MEIKLIKMFRFWSKTHQIQEQLSMERVRWKHGSKPLLNFKRALTNYLSTKVFESVFYSGLKHSMLNSKQISCPLKPFWRLSFSFFSPEVPCLSSSKSALSVLLSSFSSALALGSTSPRPLHWKSSLCSSCFWKKTLTDLKSLFSLSCAMNLNLNSVYKTSRGSAQRGQSIRSKNKKYVCPLYSSSDIKGIVIDDDSILSPKNYGT